MSVNFKVIINNRNRLSTTKKMVEDLFALGTKDIWILDNKSTYQPLLEWYKTLPSNVHVEYLENLGHHALFISNILDRISEDWCFYTDADIELNKNMPSNYQDIMYEIALKHGYNKIGLALEINDLPDHYFLKQQVIGNESGWWKNKIEDNLYKADTDTTFCLIKKCDQFASLRIAGDFTAKHMPWYIDINNLTVEEKYYNENLGLRTTTQYSKQHKAEQES